MNQMYESISRSNTELVESSGLKQWWDEIQVSFNSSDEVSRLNNCQLAAIMAYAGNIAKIPNYHYQEFCAAIDMTRAALEKMHGSSDADEKILKALSRSPYDP